MKDKKKLLWFAVAALAVGIIATILIVTTRQQPRVHQIAAILPLTGDAAEYGKNDKAGMDLAIDQCNAAGGIDGKRIEILYEDCQGQAKNAVTSMTKLSAQGVPVVLDDAISTVALAIVPIATQNKLVVLSTGASNPSLAGSSPYFFRIWNSDAEEGGFAAKFAKDTLKLSKVAILYVNNDYGNGLNAVFTKHFTAMGGAIVLAEPFDRGSKDFRSQAAKAKQAAPDGVYLVGYAADTGILAKQMAELDIACRVLGTVAMEDPEFVKLAGAAAEGVLYPFPEGPKGAEVDAFRAAFKQKYGKEPGLLCDCGYDAANLIIQAMKKGARTGDEIRTALSQVKDYPGASGQISFDKNGDVHKPMAIKVIKGGAFVTYPD